MTLDDPTCYRALVSRYARFDGLFFVGVTTTGIYCRPVCTARTPGRDRCRFFPHAALAEREGFRPCLRCRPELAPGHAPIDALANLARQVDSNFNINTPDPGPGTPASRRPLRNIAPNVVNATYGDTTGVGNYHSLQVAAERDIAVKHYLGLRHGIGAQSLFTQKFINRISTCGTHKHALCVLPAIAGRACANEDRARCAKCGQFVCIDR